MLQCSDVAMLLCCYSQTVENRDSRVSERTKVAYRLVPLQQYCFDHVMIAATLRRSSHERRDPVSLNVRLLQPFNPVMRIAQSLRSSKVPCLKAVIRILAMLLLRIGCRVDVRLWQASIPPPCCAARSGAAMAAAGGAGVVLGLGEAITLEL